MTYSEVDKNRINNLHLLDVERTFVSQHSFQRFWERKGWDKIESLYQLRRENFEKFSFGHEITKKYPHLLNVISKNNLKHKSSNYYFNERLDLVLVVRRHYKQPKQNVLITVFSISEHLFERYSTPFYSKVG